MCGIVGAIAGHDVVPTLIDGLKRLEYRGYDSAGVAVLMQGEIRRVRRIGRVVEMERAVGEANLTGSVGIGHTRWATHGGVTEPNAHPHVSADLIAVVHNGIIENHDAERARLQGLGYVFESQTDTEVIAHLVHYHYLQTSDLFKAVNQAVSRLGRICHCRHRGGSARQDGVRTHGLPVADRFGRWRILCGFGRIGHPFSDAPRNFSG